MTREPTDLARTIALIAAHFYNRPAMAFDTGGHLVDWQEIDNPGHWVHHSDPADRPYVVAGGINAVEVQELLDHHTRDAYAEKAPISAQTTRPRSQTPSYRTD